MEGKDLHVTMTKVNLCRACGATFDAAAHSANQDVRPNPGDLSLCLSCGAPGIFAEDLTVRPPTEAERAELEADPETAALLRRAKAIAHRRGPLPDTSARV